MTGATVDRDGWRVFYLGDTRNPTRYRVEIMPGVLAVVRWRDSHGRHGAGVFTGSGWTWDTAPGCHLSRRVRDYVAASLAGVSA